MDFRAAYLNSKFWTPNSIIVPDVQVTLNEDFHRVQDILRLPEQIHHFTVYWIVKGVSGEVCLPGHWNYCYIDGKYYHMQQMQSNGYIKGIEEEGFFYGLTYDDWQNDWLRDQIQLKGTIELTGDQDLVRENLVQLAPMINNVNNFRFLDGIQKLQGETFEQTKLILPEEISNNFKTLNKFSYYDFLQFNKELAKLDLGEPNPDKLIIPLLYKSVKMGNGKWNVLQGLIRHSLDGFHVYDVATDETGGASRFRYNLENLMKSDELYLLASKRNRAYSYTKTLNVTKFVKEVDLSGCTDITVLDRIKLTPLYSADRPPAKFNLKNFVIKVLNKHGGGSHLLNEFIDEADKIMGIELGTIATTVNETPKIYKNVTVEKIDRKIVEVDPDRGQIKDPTGIKLLDSVLIHQKQQKNFIWDNSRGVVLMMQGGGGPRLKNIIPPDGATDEEKTNKGKEIIDSYLSSVKKIEQFTEYSFIQKDSPGQYTEYFIDKYLSFVLPYHEYKMVSEDDPEGLLDFSYSGEAYQSSGLGLIPNYERKTFNPAVNFKNMNTYESSNSELQATDPKGVKLLKSRLIIDPLDTKNKAKNTRIDPFIMIPVYHKTYAPIPLDGKKANDQFLRYGARLGYDNVVECTPSTRSKGEERREATRRRSEMAHTLAGGGVIYKLLEYGRIPGSPNTGEYGYAVRHKQYYSACGGKTYCDGQEGRSDTSDDPAYMGDIQYAYPVLHLPTTDPEGPHFTVEVTLPLKMTDAENSVNILNILREYDNLSDNDLRGEVVNSSMKKGKIKRYIRCLLDKNNTGRPTVSRMSKAEEKAVPPDTVVSIGINCNSNTHGLQERLWRIFFRTNGEIGAQAGAIPDDIKNESSLYPSQYPKNSKGQSVLSVAYCKPHKHHGYIFYIKFYSAPLSDRFRFTNDRNVLFNKEGTEDWFVSIIPNSGEEDTRYSVTTYTPRFTFREKANRISTNAMLSFLYGGAINNTGNRYRNYHKNDKKQGTHATMAYLEYLSGLYNGNNILIGDFIQTNRVISTDIIDNPKHLSTQLITRPTPTTISEASFDSIDEAMPPFIAEYLNPDSILNETMHSGQRTPMNNDDERRQLFRAKIKEMCSNTKQLLSQYNTWLKFEGTNGYASIQLNTRGDQPVWDYELFTNERTAFQSKEREHGNFVNHIEQDIDVLINTQNELNIFGTRLPIKSRKFTTDEELDIGLSIKALPDETQTLAAIWHSVEMRLNDQDIIHTIIETPKELTKYKGFSEYERERLIRDIKFKADEYLYEKDMLEYQKRENKFMDKYEEDMNYYSWKYAVAGGAMKMVTGAIDTTVSAFMLAKIGASISPPAQTTQQFNYHGKLMNTQTTPWTGMRSYTESFKQPYEMASINHYKGRGRPPNISTTKIYSGSPDWLYNRHIGHWGVTHATGLAHGIGNMIEGGLSIGRAYDTGYVEDELRKQRYSLSVDKLNTEGNMLNKKHEYERQNLMEDLGRLSANVQFPQINNSLVYRLYNRERNLHDIFITQYYPSGKLLEYIKQYYREYGYNILVREHICTGASSIKTHLRYQYVSEIIRSEHNVPIIEMIRARAQMGIKIVPWEQ